jgi:hypothetical protein
MLKLENTIIPIPLDGGAHTPFVLGKRLCGVIELALGDYVRAEPYSHR